MDRVADQPSLFGTSYLSSLKPQHLTPAEQETIIALACLILEARHQRGECLSTPAETATYCRLRLGAREQEVFGCIFLDTRHRVISFEELFFGTVDGASVHPREVARRSIQHNAAAVIFTHNHPSGIPEPSRADEPEYDVIRVHPRDDRLFVEAVNAWGRDGQNKVEPRLLPMVS